MTDLKAFAKWVVGKVFEKPSRKPGNTLMGMRMPPRNRSMKNTLIEIGVALLALLISPVRAKPILKRHIAQKVNINQNRK